MRSETFALFGGLGCLVLGLFAVVGLPVNVADSVIHLALGGWGIAAWRRMTSPRIFSAALAIAFSALALIGLVPGMSAVLGMPPSEGLDIWLHAGAAVLGAYFALRPELSLEHRASRPDRRQNDVPVAEERRHGHADRRLPSATTEEI